MAWILLALVRSQQRAHVGTVVSFEVPEQTKDFCTNLRDCLDTLIREVDVVTHNTYCLLAAVN
jgi:hypothetical protein